MDELEDLHADGTFSRNHITHYRRLHNERDEFKTKVVAFLI